MSHLQDIWFYVLLAYFNYELHMGLYLLPPPQNEVLVEVLFLVPSVCMSVCLSVCLSVCVQDFGQTIEKISTKIELQPHSHTPSRWLDFEVPQLKEKGTIFYNFEKKYMTSLMKTERFDCWKIKLMTWIQSYITIFRSHI